MSYAYFYKPYTPGRDVTNDTSVSLPDGRLIPAGQLVAIPMVHNRSKPAAPAEGYKRVGRPEAEKAFGVYSVIDAQRDGVSRLEAY